MPALTKPRLGISSCLLGELVRYDGGHKKDKSLISFFSRHVEWFPVCPEVELGMGIPREAVNLSGDSKSPRMVGTNSGKDWTISMTRFAERRAQELQKQNIHGYIFKARSPSCGMFSVPIHNQGNSVSQKGRGLFAKALTLLIPDLPVTEEGQLTNEQSRQAFLDRVLAYAEM